MLEIEAGVGFGRSDERPVRRKQLLRQSRRLRFQGQIALSPNGFADPDRTWLLLGMENLHPFVLTQQKNRDVLYLLSQILGYLDGHLLFLVLRHDAGRVSIGSDFQLPRFVFGIDSQTENSSIPRNRIRNGRLHEANGILTGQGTSRRIVILAGNEHAAKEQ